MHSGLLPCVLWSRHIVGLLVNVNHVKNQPMWKRAHANSCVFILSSRSQSGETLHRRARRHAHCRWHVWPKGINTQLIDGLDFENCANAAQHQWLWSIHTADRFAFLLAALWFPAKPSNTFQFSYSSPALQSSPGLPSLPAAVIGQTVKPWCSSVSQEQSLLLISWQSKC